MANDEVAEECRICGRMAFWSQGHGCALGTPDNERHRLTLRERDAARAALFALRATVAKADPVQRGLICASCLRTGSHKDTCFFAIAAKAGTEIARHPDFVAPCGRDVADWAARERHIISCGRCAKVLAAPPPAAEPPTDDEASGCQACVDGVPHSSCEPYFEPAEPPKETL